MAGSSAAKRRVCLFGLSADPPTGTGGHVGIVRKLSTLSEFDEIRVLPVYRHTYASKRMRLATFADRMNMCRLAFEGIPRTIVTNDEYLSWCRKVEGITNEEERSKVSVGTAALLEYLFEKEKSQYQYQRQQQHEHEYTFCLGADAFLDLSAGKWKESDRVLQLLQGRFLVLNRIDGTPNNNNTNNNIVPTELQDRVDKVKGARLVSIPSLGGVSSSRVREAVGRGDWDDLDAQMVNPNVLIYIREKGLYASVQE